MVKINNYHPRENDDNEIFFVLEVLGEVEFVKSSETGRTYATRRKVYIPTTFDEEACKDLIGQSMPGRIIKEECAPYDYTIKDTGEIIQLDFQYVYIDQDEASKPKASKLEQIKNEIQADSKVFSENGELV